MAFDIASSAVSSLGGCRIYVCIGNAIWPSSQVTSATYLYPVVARRDRGLQCFKTSHFSAIEEESTVVRYSARRTGDDIAIRP